MAHTHKKKLKRKNISVYCKEKSRDWKKKGRRGREGREEEGRRGKGMMSFSHHSDFVTYPALTLLQFSESSMSIHPDLTFGTRDFSWSISLDRAILFPDPKKKFL